MDTLTMGRILNRIQDLYAEEDDCDFVVSRLIAVGYNAEFYGTIDGVEYIQVWSKDGQTSKLFPADDESDFDDIIDD